MAKTKIYKDKKEFDKANKAYQDSLLVRKQGLKNLEHYNNDNFDEWRAYQKKGMSDSEFKPFLDLITLNNGKFVKGDDTRKKTLYGLDGIQERMVNIPNNPKVKPIYQPDVKPTETAKPKVIPQNQRKPIIVNDKNDPRLKAYNDSLSNYNKNEILWKGWQPVTPGNAEQLNTTYEPNKVYMERDNPNLPGYDVTYKNVVKKPVQPVIFEDKPKLNKIQSLPLSPIPVDNKTNIQIPTQQVTKPTTRAVDARTYTAGKYLKSQGKSSGYINEGDGTGRKEVYANGGWLDELPKQKFQNGGFKGIPSNIPKNRLDAEAKEEVKRLNKSNEVKLTDKGLSKNSQNFIDYIRPDVYDEKQVLNLLTKNKKYTEDDFNKVNNFEVDSLKFNTSLKGDRDAQLINQGFNQKYNTFEKYKGNNNDYKIKDYDKQKVVNNYFDKEKIIKKYANNPLGNYDLEYSDIDKKVFSSRDKIYEENNFSKDVKGYEENKRFTLRDDVDGTLYPNKNAFGIMGKFTAKNNTNDKTKKYPYITIDDKIDYDFKGDLVGKVTDLMYPQNRFGIKDTIYYNPKTHKVIKDKPSKLIKNYSNGGWLDNGKQVPSTLAVKTNVIPKDQIMFPDKYVGDKDSFKKDYSKYLKNKYKVSLNNTSNILKELGANSSAFFNPFTDNINYKAMNTVSTNEDVHTLLNEIPHKIQKDKYGTVSFLYNIGKDLINYPKNLGRFLSDGEDGGQLKDLGVYENPGTLEFEAHKIIEPKLREDYRYRSNKVMGKKYANINWLDK